MLTLWLALLLILLQRRQRSSAGAAGDRRAHHATQNTLTQPPVARSLASSPLVASEGGAGR